MIEKQKSIIFDLGAVMVDWNPHLIAQGFTDKPALQETLIENLFHHQTWINFDNGLISELELIQSSSQRLKLSIDQTHSLIEHAKESLHAKLDMVTMLELAKSEGLHTFCLSNLSHEWFAYLSNRYDFFELFDGKVISAQEGIGKPSLEIYQRLLTRFNVNASDTLFIDDRLENTQAATQLGIKSITFEHSIENLNHIKQYILGM